MDNQKYKDLETMGARIIVKEEKAEDKTKSGIIIANTSAQERTYTGKVLVVGEGAYLENGTIRPMNIKVGDTVMYAKFAGTPIVYKNEEYLILNERDILIKIKSDEEQC